MRVWMGAAGLEPGCKMAGFFAEVRTEVRTPRARAVTSGLLWEPSVWSQAS